MRFKLNDYIRLRDPEIKGRKTLRGLVSGRIIEINGLNDQLLSIQVLEHKNPRCVGRIYRNYLSKYFSVIRPFAAQDVSLNRTLVDVFGEREEVS